MGKSYQYHETVGHVGAVHDAKLSRKSSSMLVSGGADGKVSVWAVSKPTTALVSLPPEDCEVLAVAFDAQEEHVLSGASTGQIKLWDLRKQALSRSFTSNNSGCTTFDYHPFGEFFCAGHEDGGLVLWDTRDKKPLQKYAGHGASIRCVQFSPDGRWVSSACAGGVVRLWDLTAGKMLHEFCEHTDAVTCLAYSPNDLLLASSSLDGCVHLYELDTFKITASINSSTGATTRRPSSASSGAGGRPASPLQWQADELDADAVHAVTFTHGSSTVVGALASEVKVWRLDGATEVASVYDLHWGPVVDLALSDELLIAVCCEENRVGVAVIDSMTKLLHTTKAGERLRGVNTGDGPGSARAPRRGAASPLHDPLPASPRARAAAAATPPSTLGRPGVAGKAPGSVRTGRRAAGGTDSLDLGVGGGMSARRSSEAPSSPRAREVPSSPRSSSLPSADLFSSMSQQQSESAAARSPGRKGFSERSLQQRQSRGVQDAIFNSEPKDDSGVRSPRASNLGSPSRMGMAEHLSRGFGASDSGEAPAPSSSSFSRLQISSSGGSSTSIAAAAAAAALVPPLEDVLAPRAPASARAARQARAATPVEDFDGSSAAPDSSSEQQRKGGGRSSSLDRLLGVDAATLAGDEPDTEQQMAAEEAVLEAGRLRHAAILTALKTRLTNYETVKLFWNTGDLKGVMSAMKLDISVAVDVMDSFRSSQDFFTLDVCSEAGCLVAGLLESPYDKYVSVGLDVLATYLRSYGPVIRDTCSQDVGAMHRDIEFESRRERCLACRSALQSVLGQLAGIAGEHDDINLARKAQELEQEIAAL